MLQQTQIDKLIEEIISGYAPEKIYLFGSYAMGKQTINSDIDLLIIKDTSKRKIDRNREVRRCIKTYPENGLDIFVYTPKELKEGLQQTVHVGKEAVNTGKIMYERIEKWFCKSKNDLLVIKNNLSADEIPIDACCFHAQQAAEKYLKAYLVSKQINFPKIHDLQALLNLCIAINAGFNKILEPAISLSDYAIAPRYPDAFDDLTIDDANNAQKDALEIKDFVLKNFFN